MVALVPGSTGDDDSHGPILPTDGEKITPKAPGVEEPITLQYGPYVVSPGQDLNRPRIDVAGDGGFVTEIGVEMLDATTGEHHHPLRMHLHHGHWLGPKDDPTANQGFVPLLDWRWGTGDEKTRGDATAVADAEPGGPRYGVYLEPGEPQGTEFMIHNQEPTPRTIVIRLNLTFVHGSAEEIANAEDCQDEVPEDGRCRAGARFHDLQERLWGSTFDVPREEDGDGTYVWPTDAPGGSELGDRWREPFGGEATGAPWSGTIVIGAAHLHQNGKNVVVANLGPEGSGCAEDVDGDGWPGVTIYTSRTEDLPSKAWPHSYEYQVTATQPAWRAPIHEGDRLTLFGTYANQDQAEAEAMAFAGVYVDTQQPPGPAEHGDGCDVSALEPSLTGQADAQPGFTEKTRPFEHDHAPVCNRVGLGALLDNEEACNREASGPPGTVDVNTVQIEDFTYTPGDIDAPPPAGWMPVVERGEEIVFYNHDTGINVQHTVTSCRWPCNGARTLNYPQDSGHFHSGKMGNFDPIDGGANDRGDLPHYRLDTSDLEPGKYAYYCRMHPSMRGWFEVVPSTGGLD